MTIHEVQPLSTPGVHDIVENDLGDGRTEFVCEMGDYPGVVAHTANRAAMSMARLVAHDHAARHRRGPCHAACYDEHGHTDGCLYDGEEE